MAFAIDIVEEHRHAEQEHQPARRSSSERIPCSTANVHKCSREPERTNGPVEGAVLECVRREQALCSQPAFTQQAEQSLFRQRYVLRKADVRWDPKRTSDTWHAKGRACYSGGLPSETLA